MNLRILVVTKIRPRHMHMGPAQKPSVLQHTLLFGLSALRL